MGGGLPDSTTDLSSIVSSPHAEAGPREVGNNGRGYPLLVRQRALGNAAPKGTRLALRCANLPCTCVYVYVANTELGT